MGLRGVGLLGPTKGACDLLYDGFSHTEFLVISLVWRVMRIRLYSFSGTTCA